MDTFKKAPKRGVRQDEAFMELQISATKAAICLRNYRKTRRHYWLNLAENHLATSNFYLQNVDRNRSDIADLTDYVDAEHCRTGAPVVSIGRAPAVCSGL